MSTKRALHYREDYCHSFRGQTLYPEDSKHQEETSLSRHWQENLYKDKFSARGLSNFKLEGQKINRRSRFERSEVRLYQNFEKKEKYSSSRQNFWSSPKTNVKTRNPGDGICRLRSFNNWAKSYLMIKSLPQKDSRHTTGLDLGCSKGADLKKWHHCHIDHLYLVENDPLAMKECRQRFSNLQASWPNFYDATFIQKDFTTDSIFISKRVDIVSCQMALHRAFESRSKAECMAKNVANSLKRGGIFVVSISCSSRILESLKSSPTGTIFGNPIYQVKTAKPLPGNPPDFGVKFEFMVGCNKFEEYLVQVHVLEKVMIKYGLVLKERKPFLQMYFEVRTNTEQVQCMRKMGVIRWGHEGNKDHKVYLTMSEPERQVASLYEALTFKKIL